LTVYTPAPAAAAGSAPARAVPIFLLIDNRSTPVPATAKSPVTQPATAEINGFWPVERIIARGYGAAMFHNSELSPDDPKRFREGVLRLFEGDSTTRPADAPGALAAWAWGASRAMDYLQTDPRVDAAHVGVVGHSRGGKAALWAGACDPRFAMVISNSSGEGGAAIMRRRFGETVAAITSHFPHWFCADFQRFADHEDRLPFDAHMLLALIAPRALYVTSHGDDLWADPRGEFLALAESSPAYALFGFPPIAPDAMPGLDRPLIAGVRGYHVHAGKHDLTTYDWDRFMDFSDRLGWRARDAR
jgi:hypothetical protein